MTTNIEIQERATVRFPLQFLDQAGEPLSLVGATLYLDMRKPDGEMLEVTPTLTNDGSDGLAEYTTGPTDLIGAGEWVLQGWAIKGAQKFPSDIHRFSVRENLIDR